MQVTIEDENIPFHTAFFTNGIFEEVYTELFTLIRERNKIYNQKANLHLPINWYKEDYKELLDIFNSDYEEKLLSRDGITLLNVK